MTETKSNFLILFFPDFRQILFLFIYLMHPCTWLIFCTVLTVSLMTGLSSFGALPQCDIVFTWDFSVFCHSIFLDSILGNYNGMEELFEKRGCRTSKYFLLGGSPALCPNGGRNRLWFAPSLINTVHSQTSLSACLISNCFVFNH